MFPVCVHTHTWVHSSDACKHLQTHETTCTLGCDCGSVFSTPAQKARNVIFLACLDLFNNKREKALCTCFEASSSSKPALLGYQGNNGGHSFNDCGKGGDKTGTQLGPEFQRLSQAVVK